MRYWRTATLIVYLVVSQQSLSLLTLRPTDLKLSENKGMQLLTYVPIAETQPVQWVNKQDYLSQRNGSFLASSKCSNCQDKKSTHILVFLRLARGTRAVGQFGKGYKSRWPVWRGVQEPLASLARGTRTIGQFGLYSQYGIYVDVMSIISF